MTASYSLLFFRVDTFSYHSTLQQLFKEYGNGGSENQLATITTKIMQALQSNLEGKSKQYKDPSLTISYEQYPLYCKIRTQVRNHQSFCYKLLQKTLHSRSFSTLLGQIHRRVVQQHANQYKRIAWSKVFILLHIHA